MDENDENDENIGIIIYSSLHHSFKYGLASNAAAAQRPINADFLLIIITVII